jgi:hypothetical protein
MPFEPIIAVDDPRLADYRSVSDPELARARGLFIAEGRLVVKRVIADGRYTVRSVLVSEASRRDLEPSLEAWRRARRSSYASPTHSKASPATHFTVTAWPSLSAHRTGFLAMCCA